MSLARLPEALAETGLLAFERPEPGRYRLLGEPPAWLLEVWPNAGTDERALAEGSLFLAEFLERMEPAFSRTADFLERSGVWAETAPDGSEVHFEATAIRHGTAKHLLLQRLRGQFDFQRRVLQQARDQKLRDIAQARHNAEAGRIRDLFVAALGHRLRGPLSVVHGALELLREEQAAGAAKSHPLAMASEAIDRMNRLVDALLELEQAVLAAQASPAAPVEAVALLREAVAGLPPQAAERVVFAPGSRSPLARARSDGAVRALSELLQNAVSHGPDGAPIRCGVETRDQEVRFTISDGGPRLAEALTERLFEPFALRRGDDTTGVGLALAHALATGMGGRIENDWEARGGNRFTLVLPLAG